MTFTFVRQQQVAIAARSVRVVRRPDGVRYFCFVVVVVVYQTEYRQLESKLGRDGRSTAAPDMMIRSVEKKEEAAAKEAGSQSLDRNPFHKNRTIAKISWPPDGRWDEMTKP